MCVEEAAAVATAVDYQYAVAAAVAVGIGPSSTIHEKEVPVITDADILCDMLQYIVT